MDIFEKCYAPSLAGELKEKGVYPYFHALQSRQDVEVTMEGKRRIMLGSNNYLGLTIQPEVVEAGVKALEQYGTGCSGSRFLNGTLELHLELEAELAKFLRKDGVVTFGTGFQSNVGIISALVDRHDYVICDKENHASIYAGCQMSYGKMLRYRHNDMAELERILQKIDGKNGVLIVTDGVFSMGGDIAKLPEICALARKYGARVMVDDAHGLGVLGEGGRGTASYFGLEDQVDIYMGTFSKSLASLGGYMAASAEVAEFVRHASRPFIFSASIPPANCATALAALRPQQGDHAPIHPHHAEEVGVKQPLCLLGGGKFDGAGDAEARVVHHQVDMSLCRHHLIHGGAQRLLPGDVRHDVGDVRHAFRPAAQLIDGPAALPQGQRRGAADPGGASGDDSDFFIHGASPSRPQ